MPKQTRQFSRPFLLLFLFFTLAQCKKSNDLGTGSSTDNNNNKQVGASAKELLTADKPSILLEINYMPGNQPQSTTLNELSNFLTTYTRKASLQVIQKEIPASGKDTLSFAEIATIEKQNRTAFSTSNQVAVYLLVTDNKSGKDDIIGAAYRNTSIVLFGRTIKTFSSGPIPIQRWKLETTTVEHEFGHLLGLVDLGTPMVTNHKDPANPQHCNNGNCLMYYKTETSHLLGRLASGNIPVLDGNCHADLIANGGK